MERQHEPIDPIVARFDRLVGIGGLLRYVEDEELDFFGFSTHPVPGTEDFVVPCSGFTVPRMGTTSVADALFTKVQQRVLAVLFGDPARSFYASELIARVASGNGAVQRELARLAASGLVTVQRVGRQKHYQANRASPVFEELRSLVLKTSGLADVLRAAFAPFASGIAAAFVFGSVAKRQDTAASDVDLFVIADDLEYADLYAALAPAEPRLGRSVNPTLLTRAELARRVADGNAFATRVLDGPKLWLIGGPGDLPAR